MNPSHDPYAAPAYHPDPFIKTGLSAFTKWVYLATLSLTTVLCLFAGGLVEIFSYYEHIDIGSKWIWALVGLPCSYRIVTVYRTPSNIAVHARKWFPAILRVFGVILMALSLFISVTVTFGALWHVVSVYIQFHLVEPSLLTAPFKDNLISGAMAYVGLPGLVVFEFSQLTGYLVRRFRERKNAA